MYPFVKHYNTTRHYIKNVFSGIPYASRNFHFSAFHCCITQRSNGSAFHNHRFARVQRCCCLGICIGSNVHYKPFIWEKGTSCCASVCVDSRQGKWRCLAVTRSTGGVTPFVRPSYTRRGMISLRVLVFHIRERAAWWSIWPRHVEPV